MKAHSESSFRSSQQECRVKPRGQKLRVLRFFFHGGWVACVAAVLLMAGPFALLAHAQAGSLDKSFNGTGKVLTDFSNGSDDEGFAVAIDGQGRVVVGGYSDLNFALARYNPDGSLDTTFGTNGLVTTDFGGNSDDRAYCIAIQSDGKIVLGGRTDANGSIDFALARYNPDGSLDTSFGTGGLVTTDLSGSGSDDRIFALAIDSSGKIVAAGWFNTLTSIEFALARYNPDGTLDTTFGTNGLVTTDFSGNGSNNSASSLAIDSDGKIVVAGSTVAGSTSEFALARYNADGTLDTTFGTSGKVTNAAFSGLESSLAIDSNGKIVALGQSSANNGDFALARYNPDGTLDTTFGTDGLATTDFSGSGSNDRAESVAIDSNGKIVAAGWTNLSGNFDFALSRYTSAGVLDGNFGSGGKVTTDFTGSGGGDFAYSVAIDHNGNIVAAGDCISSNDDFCVARYKGIVTADLSISKTGSPNPVIAGDTVTYTIKVTNSGPDDATGVVATDDLPSALGLVSCAATSGGVCGESGNHVTVRFPTLTNGSTGTITLETTVKAGTAGGTSIVNTATVTSDDADPVSTNNSATATVTVLGTADLLTNETVTKGPLRLLTYSLGVQNLGPDAAAQIVLTDVIPANTVFVSVSQGAWNCSAPPLGGTGTLTCTLDSLAMNATETVDLTVLATPPAHTQIANTVSVSSGTNDPNLSNNSTTLITGPSRQ